MAENGPGRDEDPTSFMQLMYEQAAESDTVERVRKAAGESAEGMEATGQTLQQVGQQALNATMNLVDKARDFAVEFSESLWDGRGDEKDKI